MGEGIISVNLFVIVMNRLILDIVKRTGCNIEILMKYIDNIFCIIKKDEIEQFFKALNYFNPQLNFTLEMEKEKNPQISRHERH